MADQTLQCRDCGRDFVWTESEQEFYKSKGFNNPPVRCPECRAKRKAEMHNNGGGGGYNRGPRQMFQTTCAECGKQTEVPFQPRGDKPVYCRECFDKRRTH